MLPIGPFAEFGFLPQRKVKPDLFSPRPYEIPWGRLRCLVFQFPSVAARTTQEKTEALEDDFVFWGMNGIDSDSSGFRVQIVHTIQQADGGAVQRQLYNRKISNVNGLGTAKNPFLLVHPQLVHKGDTLYCEVTNLSASGTNAYIEVMLSGVLPGVSPRPR